MDVHLNGNAFGAGIYFIPNSVWQSGIFWILMVLMIVGIILYHNFFFRKPGSGNLTNKNLNHMSRNKNPDQPRISYTSEGPSGYLHFQNKASKFSLYYEFGSGSCVANIHIQNPESWEKQTNLPLAQREVILDFIGQQVVKDQTKNGRGYFKIEGAWLNIYH